MNFVRISSVAALLCRSTRAVGAVELALIAPLLGICIVGITDVARATAVKFRLQQATNRGVEIATIATTKASAGDIQSETAAAAGVLPSQVALTWTLKCDGAATSYALTCGSTQETARYVRVEVATTYQPMFRYGVLGNAPIPMSAYSSVRIE